VKLRRIFFERQFMQIAFDQNGYAYDTASGLYINVGYDDQGNAYDQDTGERIDDVILDSSGATTYTGGGGVNWNQIINTAAQAYVGGQGAAQSGKYIPQANQSPYGYQTLSNRPGMTPGPGGGASVNISTNTLMLIVGGVILFMLGQKKGR
jgi:hypothetical protein